MHVKSLASLVLCITASLSAQTATPAPSPTMQQTIDFMKELYSQQEAPDVLQLEYPQFNIHEKRASSFQLEEPCSLVVKNSIRDYVPGKPNPTFAASTTLIDLTRSEPTSVSVKPSSTVSPVLYTVVIGNASRQVRSPVDAADDQPALSLPPGTDASGQIQSIQNDTVLFVRGDGRLISYKHDGKPKIVTPVPGEPGKTIPASLSDFTARDFIVLYSKQVTLVKQERPAVSGNGPFDLLSVADNDVATRLAKALIHALVLCHKDSKPSLF